jgi:hypothetical protein
MTALYILKLFPASSLFNTQPIGRYTAADQVVAHPQLWQDLGWVVV